MKILPTFPDEPNYTISPMLDGVGYELTFRFSEREACWYLDLALGDGTPLVGGKKVVCGVSIWGRHRYNPSVPQGHLIVAVADGTSDDPPTLGELGDGRRCLLAYAAAGEIP